MKNKFYILLPITVFFFYTCFVSDAVAQQWCNICAMDLQKYKHTKYILTLKDSTKKYTCSLHCAAIIIDKNNVIKIEVSDYLTGKIIDAKTACFLVESDIKGVMSNVSKLAFGSKKDAENLQKKHNGRLTDLKGALKTTSLLMSKDKTMIADKVKNLILLGNLVAEENSCFICHGQEGKGNIINPGAEKKFIPMWSSKETVNKITSKSRLKDIILNGVSEHDEHGVIKMPAFKNIIKGKELHALTNYVWMQIHTKQ